MLATAHHCHIGHCRQHSCGSRDLSGGDTVAVTIDREHQFRVNTVKETEDPGGGLSESDQSRRSQII